MRGIDRAPELVAAAMTVKQRYRYSRIESQLANTKAGNLGIKLHIIELNNLEEYRVAASSQ